MYGWRPPFQLGEALLGGAVGEVAASSDPAFKPGDLVFSAFGWREWFNAPAEALRKLDTAGLPPQTFLGVSGMTGLTAWSGLLRVAGLKPGDVVPIPMKPPGRSEMMAPMDSDMMSPRARRLAGSGDLASFAVAGQSLF
jgi:ABC-type nitrate/sulfonate/bicarbonate transport system substrate-binding protein